MSVLLFVIYTVKHYVLDENFLPAESKDHGEYVPKVSPSSEEIRKVEGSTCFADINGVHS